MKIDWAHFTPSQFEEFCYRILEVLAFKNLEWHGVKGMDKGRDIVAEKVIEIVPGHEKSEKYLFQCKRYLSRSPTRSDLKEALISAEQHHPDYMVFIISNILSSGTKDWLKDVKGNYLFQITVLDRLDLESIVLKHKTHLWPFLPEATRQDLDLAVSDLYPKVLWDSLKRFEHVFATLLCDLKRQQHGIEIKYLLDFSEVYTYLYPLEAEPGTDIGYIQYMFAEKSPDDHYIFSPYSVWELLNHLKEMAARTKEYSNFQIILKNRRIKEFYRVLTNPPANPEEMNKKLMDAYRKMGGLRSIIVLADETTLETHMRKSVKRIEKLVMEKKIEPLDLIIDSSKVKNEAYKQVLNFLGRVRKRRLQNNIVDALNMGLTLQLTETSYKTRGKYYLLVSHSKWPLLAFKQIRWRDDPLHNFLLVREPVFMTAKLALKDRTARFLRNGKHLFEHLLKHRNHFDSSQISSRPFEGEKSLKEEFLTFFETVKKFSEYRKDYAPLLLEVTEINSSVETETATRQEAKILADILREKELYSELMMRAHEKIRNSLRDTYSILYSFISERHNDLLTPEMKAMLESL